MPGPVISVSDLGILALPPVQLFNDTFDSGVLDTTNRWQPCPTAQTVIGATTLAPGTVAGAVSLLQSQVAFRPTEPGFLFKVARINIEFPVLSGHYRFWGLATVSAAGPTIANPLIEAMGYEISASGKLFAVTYQTGTRVVIQDLSVQSGSKAQPQDSAAHKYFTYFRGDIGFWAIDDQANVVASYQTGANGPNANTLPITTLVVSGGLTAPTVAVNGVTVADTARTTQSLADGLYGWRKQTVTSAGAALVQAVSPVSIGLNNPAGGVDILRTDGAGRLNDSNEDLLRQLIREVRVTNRLLLVGLNVDVDIDANTDTDYD